jgi:predicted DCC family thiol-disulfide oxidoreductase YuxK
METLTILYDAACPVCVRCRAFMEDQPTFVRLEFVAQGGAVSRARYGALAADMGELCVISDRGEVWLGPAAFLLCLWALEGYRELALTLSEPPLLPLARRFFHAFSSNRRALSAFLSPPVCTDRQCALPHAPRAYR